MAITDKLSDTFNAANPNVAKVAATRAAAGATLTCDSLSGWPVSATSPVHFSTYQVDTSGNVIAGTQIDWKGLVTSSTTIGSLTRQAGASDSGNSIGDYVEMLPTGSFGHDLYTALTKEHNKSDGSHGAITATSVITTAAVTAGNGLTVSAGTITAPTGSLSTKALTNPYKFSVYLAAAQSITTGTSSKINYDTKLFDTSSNIDVASNKGRFTAPIAGFYQFNASVNFGSINGNTGGSIYLFKNGSAILGGTSFEVGTSVWQPQFIVSGLLQLAANDFVEVYYNNADTINRNANAGQTVTYFQGFLVSAT